jgi:hypothetical protein
MVDFPYSRKKYTTFTGWWYTFPSEKYEFVSWDDKIPNIWKTKIHVPNNQPVYGTIMISCACEAQFVAPVGHFLANLDNFVNPIIKQSLIT